MSGPELFGNSKARHDGFERMFMDIGPTVRVGADLVLQSIDIPEFGRGRVGIEEIVDAERDAPARWQRTMNVEVQLAEALPIDLPERRRRVNARCGYAWEIMHGNRIDAGPGGERIVPEIAIVESAAPGA